MNDAAKVVMAIDPGRSKCGVAVVKRSGSDTEYNVLYQDVIETKQLTHAISSLASRYKPEIIVLGNGTTSSNTAQLIASLNIAPIEMIDEEYTTLQARKRFFYQNPPKGFRRLIPLSLQTPNRPYDDFVAVILAEKYLQGILS